MDVYAVGAILYELLDGPAAVSRHDRARNAWSKSRPTDPVPPSRLVPGVPRDIETICLKCLQKEPGKRYETAQALGDDLRRFLRRTADRWRDGPAAWNERGGGVAVIAGRRTDRHRRHGVTQPGHRGGRGGVRFSRGLTRQTQETC